MKLVMHGAQWDLCALVVYTQLHRCLFSIIKSYSCGIRILDILAVIRSNFYVEKETRKIKREGLFQLLYLLISLAM